MSIWISVLALAVAASMDCMILGFHYEVKGVRIGRAAGLFISLLCVGGTWISMVLGRWASEMLQRRWEFLAGGWLFMLLGIWMFLHALFPKDSQKQTPNHWHPERVDKNDSKVIELRESMLIALLLCANNVGIGIGGGAAGIPLLLTALLCGIMSYLFLSAGSFLGRKLAGNRLSSLLEFASAALIFIIGLGQLLGRFALV